MHRSTRTALVAGGLLWACACTDGNAQGRAASAPMRERPTARTMERAFARVSDEVERCLTSDAPAVRVRGAFDGDEGTFALESVRTPSGSEPPFAVATCVRAIVERARVRPFRAESARADHDFIRESAGGSTATTISTTAASATSSGPTIPTSAGSNGSVQAGSLRFGPSPEDLVRREHDALQRCFEQASEQAADIEGELEVRFTLDARGRVTQSAHRVLRERNANGLLVLVGQCIEAHVRLIAFGAQPDGGTLHIVPIAFGSREHFAPASSLPVE